jgi:hypothetical protein
MVLSKGCEVVGPGYSRLLGNAARVVDRGRESGSPKRAEWVHWEYDIDQQTDQVTRDSRGNRDGYLGQWADRVTRDSRGNRDGGSGQQADRVTWLSQGNRDNNLKSRNSCQVNRVGNTE